MRSVNFFFMTAGLAQCIAAAPAEAGADQLNIRTDTDDVPDYSADSDWDFATLDEAYDPEDPAIKDLPEIDPSEIVFTDYDAEMNGTSPNPIARGLTQHFCGMTNYPHPTVGPIRDGLSYLHNGGNQKFCVAKKKCGRISCSYGTGFNVCNGKAKEQCYTLGGIGKRLNFLTHHVCGIGTSCSSSPFCSPDNCCDREKRAYQGFYERNFNIIVKGGFDC
ncbi:hypothetical protein F4821DRAFT_260587 [Hypoxylon rubiginosum]|uniref:Uncharacterized protein n=1 Tax=Hypoxylon rubiginosum TaxID=110542 RepID=A0ACC0CZL6_9PEZI|nr:hypothetical protein F4821DRAFT_260587 [Hypoxylon rubiginosum]